MRSADFKAGMTVKVDVDGDGENLVKVIIKDLDLEACAFMTTEGEYITFDQVHGWKPKMEVCFVCEGEGTTVNPDIDCNGLTREDFDDDPDFREDYMAGRYDITCRGCGGLRVVPEGRRRQLSEAADDRRLAAREDGNVEAYMHAHDYRYG